MLDYGFSSQIEPAFSSAPYREFDFWLGEWSNCWRQRINGEFFHSYPGTPFRHWILPLLGGKALVELATSIEPVSNGPAAGHPIRGCSIRYFDPATRDFTMAESWPFPNQPTGFWEQLRGQKHHGRFEMLSTRRDQDRRVHTLRYTFSDIGRDALRWDQARSWDCGETWRIGSVAEFARISSNTEWPQPDQPFPYDRATR